MPAPVHVAMVIGGAGVGLLPRTIRHYRALGVRSFFVVLHLPEPRPADVERVSRLATSCGIRIAWVEVDPDFSACKDRCFTRLLDARPGEWFLPIDCDELQRYPAGLLPTLEYCEQRGYDYVRGCLVDRIAADGSLSDLKRGASVWRQYPLGGFITYPLLGGDPRKIVAAKGHVRFYSCGHHDASSGAGCPGSEHLIPVHHFKWVGTLIPYLAERREVFRRVGNPYWVESHRGVEYLERHGRIDVSDRRFLIAPCTPEYRFWPQIREALIELEALGTTPAALRTVAGRFAGGGPAEEAGR